MALALATLRDLVEAELRDTGNLTWSAAQVDLAIQLALDEYGRAAPREAQTTVQPTTARVIPLATELSAADYALLLDVTGVEFPKGAWPPTYVQFSRHGANVTIHSEAAPSGTADAELFYTTLYTMDATPSSNVPEAATQVLLLGASGFALQQLAAARAETINIAGDAVANRLAQQGYSRVDEFRRRLNRLRRPSIGRLVRPEDTYTGRDIVRPPGETL